MIERKDNIIIGDTWEELGIEIPGNKITSGSDTKIKNCPECKRLGKRNDFSLSIQPLNGVSKCHKCGCSFILRKEKKVERKPDFTPPDRKNLTALSKEGLEYFVNRRISQEAVNFFKIIEGKNKYVAFPYLFEGKLVNIKFKNIKEKKYMQSPGGMHVVFNHDEAKKYNAVLVAEGEEEVMCWYDAGIPYAVSVDAGAPNPNDRIEKKLECIDNSIELFENADVIYIAVDNDENGRRLEQELIRRFHIEKVKLVSYAPYKDANEYVLHEGRDKLKVLLDKAKDIRMEGVFYAHDVEDRLWDMYNNGLVKGTTTYMPSIDDVWKWRPGETTVISGYAGEGKSALFDINLPVLKSFFEGNKWGLYIPENMPVEQWYEDVIHTFIGKTSDKDYPAIRMTQEEYAAGIEFVKKHFFIIYPEKDATTENLFKRFDYLVRKEGIRGIIIDPFNMIEKMFGRGETYDQSISNFMSQLTKYAEKRSLYALLVCHQNRPEKKNNNGDYSEPDPYNTKGGPTFLDKCTNFLTTWRPLRNSDPGNPLVVIRSWKIKMKKLVAPTGSTEILFHWQSNRFTDPKLGDKNPLDMKQGVTANLEEKEISELYDDDDDGLPF